MNISLFRRKDAGQDESAADGAGYQPPRYFDDQFDDEEVLFMFRKHPIVMRKGLLIGSIATLIGPVATVVLMTVQPDKPPSLIFFFGSILASFVLAAIVFLPSWISWHFSVYIVTDQRFIQITQKGMFSRSVVDMNLRQIQMVNYQVSGLQETIFGFGTILMQTLVGDLVIHEVHHPDKIQKRLLTVLRAEGVAASGDDRQYADDADMADRVQRFDEDEEYERA